MPLKDILEIKRLSSPFSSEIDMSTASIDNSLYGSYKNSLFLLRFTFELNYRVADKSLARPGRKQATATTLELCKPLKKKFRNLSVQPGLRGINDLRVGREMATFQLFLQSGRAKDLSHPCR